MKARSKKINTLVALATSLVSAWSWSAAAQNMGSGTGGSAGRFYLGGDAGVAIMQNVLSHGNTAQYDVSPRIDLSVGYDLTQNIAVELQSGYTRNTWPTVKGVIPIPGPEPILIGAILVPSTEIWTVPVMVNGIYKYSFNNHLQAYGGLGVGAVFSTWDENIPGRINVSPTDCEFGYQAMFGVNFLIDENLECGLGYSFLGSADHHYSTQHNGSLTTSPTYMHAILVSLTYRF